MSGFALAVALRLALGDVDGGDVAREVDELQSASLVLVDGTRRDVDGGAYLPEESFEATARELADLRTQNATYQANATATAPAPPAVVLVVVAVVAAVLGAGATLLAVKH